MPPGALDNVKVADFTWVIAGPIVTRYLANHGATVVRVESQAYPDYLRYSRPYKDNTPGLNTSGLFALYNSDKYSLGLNLKHPKGLELARRLIGWCDVVVENFTPGTVERLGLDYEHAKEIKPDIIMLSLSAQGQNGPHCKYPGYGIELQSLAGFTALLGWPDRSVVQPYGALTDYISGHLATAAVLAALDCRRRTGEGAYIDVSQIESSLQFLAPLTMQYLVSGEDFVRIANRSTTAVPHGAYRCRGNDKWVVITVWDDQQWQKLCQVIDQPDLAEARFQTVTDRMEHVAELDQFIEEWTIAKTAEDVINLLREHGIEAVPVQDTRDLYEDPQLKHRHHFQVLNHPEMGPCAYEGPPFKLSKTTSKLNMPAPCLGQHNEYVCTNLLGLSDSEFVELLTEGVLE